jgi:CheY-like chemotaxis protein
MVGGGSGAERQMIWIDADALLDRLAVAGGGTVDRFRTAVEQALGTPSGSYRVFGELVALLAARGMLDEALEIESLGHALAASGVPVLCAYDLRQLDGGDARARVAGAHHCAIDMTAGTGPLVLLADDFDDARELYREYLQMQGFTVVTAVDGIDAVERARETRPAAILLDIRMPRLSGIDAMKVMKADPALAGVPIVALTAHALGEEREMFLAAGFDAVLAKPCLPDTLADTVRTFIGRQIPTATLA